MSHKKYTRPQRMARLARWKVLCMQGKPQGEAAAEVGVALNTLKRWDNPPKKAAAKIGRRRKVTLNEDEKRVYQAAILQYECIPSAVDALIVSDEVTPETRQAIGEILNKAAAEGKRPSWGKELVTLAQIPEAVAADYRGPKHRREFEAKARRDGTIVLENGERIPLHPGCIYESDDMSVNEAFRFYDPSIGRETVGRQGLFTADTASKFNLQLDLCGRPRDAYRMEDIADHMLAVVEAHGIPLCWRLERGPWENNFINGIKIEGRKERWGSLGDLFHIRRKHHSTGKANIERSFHEQQKLSAHASTSIGRKRGEFEKATKLYLKANKGNPQALQYFWNIRTCADALATILSDSNREQRTYPKLDGLITSPEKLFSGKMTTPLEDDVRWYFLPVKRQLTVRKGVIECKVDHYPRTFRFITQGIAGLPLFPEGYPVLIAFHPARPGEGCHIFNAAVGGKNIYAMAFGQKIGMAPLFDDVPEEDLSGKGEFGQVSKASAAIRKETRTIVPAGTGPGTLQSIARDGLGNALEMQTGGAAKSSPGTQPDRAPVKPRQREPKTPEPSVKMSRFGNRNAAEEIARLSKKLEEA